MKYSIIAAISDNFVIGRNNEIPWHISEDLKLFKKLTLGKILIMGRKTFESIGRPLPGRTTIVLSGSEDVKKKLTAAGISVCCSLEAALKTAAEISGGKEAREVLIAGGASIYAQAIAGAEKLYLSRVPGSFDGDTFFPEFSEADWRLENKEDFTDFTLEIYSRITV
ncbi:MAG: dihydrofolate reductase [Spirochaetales bacterium]|nr:dihydrofolate reductase [Spirochaetales bacterium]